MPKSLSSAQETYLDTFYEMTPTQSQPTDEQTKALGDLKAAADAAWTKFDDKVAANAWSDRMPSLFDDEDYRFALQAETAYKAALDSIKKLNQQSKK
jgi:hypothetical protein